MKRIVQITVLVAALLLLTGVASAVSEWCECYEVTCTHLESGDKITHFVEMCFEPWNGYGIFEGICGDYGQMSLFWDTRIRAITTSTQYEWTVASLEFHGGLNGVTGIAQCSGERWSLLGHAVDEENCNEK